MRKDMTSMTDYHQWLLVTHPEAVPDHYSISTGAPVREGADTLAEHFATVLPCTLLVVTGDPAISVVSSP